MNFAEPNFLLVLLLVVPAATAFLVWTWRRQRAALKLFVGERLLPQLTVGVSPYRPHLKRALLVLALAALLLALARPRWGYTEQETRASGLDIVVCLDVSRSMLAADAKPSRLARAKLAAFDLLEVARGDRVGLVAFAGTAFLQVPLALDPEAFRQSVRALDTETLPEPGTALAEAIREARTAFRSDSQAARVIILITDGEDHEDDALEAARAAFQDGARIFTLGLGTPQGEVLRTTDPYGNPVFIRDEAGNVVKSKLDEALLKQMAETGGGFYLPLQNAQTLATLYRRGLASLPRGDFAGGKLRQWLERFQWPLGLAIALLMAETLVAEARNPRRRVPAPAPAEAEPAVTEGAEA
jgi:Ca-activated chloride channel homolog